MENLPKSQTLPSQSSKTEAEDLTIRYTEQINENLKEWVPGNRTKPERLHEAMNYSLNAGGKRFRPLLLIASYLLYPSNKDPLPAAISVECLHTSSLVHDDLPCMDNSELRRGQPSCHIAYDEATALLTGYTLLNQAFLVLSQAYKNTPSLGLELSKDLSYAASSTQLAGGQMMDLLSEEKDDFSKEEWEFIISGKTAALFSCCLRMGFRIGNNTDLELLEKMTRAGLELGFCFQIIDDILDTIKDTETLGKPAQLDQFNQKRTTLSLYSLEEATKLANLHGKKAIDLIKSTRGNSYLLEHLVSKILNQLH